MSQSPMDQTTDTDAEKLRVLRWVLVVLLCVTVASRLHGVVKIPYNADRQSRGPFTECSQKSTLDQMRASSPLLH